MIVDQAEATLGWADALLARDSTDLYVWATLDGEPVRQAVGLLDRLGVVAVTVALADADPRRVSLALELARRLTSWRQGACLTVWSQPVPPPGYRRVPHLVTVQAGSAEGELVVWELVPASALQGWLGTPSPDLTFVESHLDSLLRLRAMVRAGRVPATSAAARLLDLLDGSHDLSIEFVYEHRDFMRELLDTWKPPSL